MEYLINGRRELAGELAVSGAKNAALKLIIAALLLKGKSQITNVPRIRDILALVEIINFLGGRAEFIDHNTVEIENQLTKNFLPLEVAARTRTSIMLLAPLLYTFKEAKVANPGGCRLGERSVDRLIASLTQMGALIEYNSEDGYYYATLKEAHTSQITFAKKSHTGTELAMMFAAKIKGQTLIENAAQEPEVDDLIRFLNLAGAHIRREGEDIIVEGQNDLTSTNFSVQSDRIEAVTFIVLSSVFGGKVTVANVDLPPIEPFLAPYKQAGFDYEYQPEGRIFRPIVPEIIRPVDVMTAPHPGFLTDWQPLWVLLMTQAAGDALVHETVFENRFSYIQDLRKFGVKVDFVQPKVEHPESLYQFNNYDPAKHRQQAVLLHGPSKLHNGVAVMTDIRAGACLVIAALMAKGRSLISGAEQIERGYENLVGKLEAIGAEIKVHHP